MGLLGAVVSRRPYNMVLGATRQIAATPGKMTPPILASIVERMHFSPIGTGC